MKSDKEPVRAVVVDKWYYDALEDFSSGGASQYPELPVSVLLQQLGFKFRKKRFRNEAVRQKHYDTRPVCDAKALALLSFLKQRKENGQRVIVVFSPHPQEPTLSASDGYMRRVAAIDQALFEKEYRVYLYDSPYWKLDEPRCDYFGSGSLQLTYNSRYSAHREFVREIVRCASVCYIQSVLRLMSSVFPENEAYLVNPFGFCDVRYVLDMHGTVPAELSMEGKTAQSLVAEKAECLCVENADIIVLVNDVSHKYLEDKYGADLPKTVTCPIFSCSSGGRVSKPAGNRVVYAGGNPAWQLIDEMRQAIAECPLDDVYYDILINGVSEEEKSELLKAGCQFVGSVSAGEVAEHYKEAHFGFMLRDASDINKYSAPTKLFEYLSFGIIPIVKSSALGDFSALGMRCVSVEDFKNGILPDKAERMRMAEQNYRVLEAVNRMRDDGLRKLAEMLGVAAE